MTDREGARILIVDDDRAVCNSLRVRLREEGYQCAVAHDGEQALTQFGFHPFDLVVADLRMPRVHGQELISRLMEREPNLGIIAMTGVDDARLALAMFDLGVDDFVFKPFNDDLFLARVRRVLADKRRLRELHDADHPYASQMIRLEERVQTAVRLRDVDRQEASARLAGLARTFSEMLARRESQSDMHGSFVEEVAGAIARAAGLDETMRHKISLAALLHDIGEFAIPDGVRNTPEPERTAKERTTYQQHVELGTAVLSEIPGFESVCDIIREHHENFDGTGYPEGTAGESISMGGRILRIADALGEKLRGGALTPERLDGATRAIAPRVGTVLDPALWVVARPCIDRMAQRLREARALTVSANAVRAGDIVVQALRDTTGHLLVGEGQRLSTGNVTRLRRYHEMGRLPDTIRVLRPAGG